MERCDHRDDGMLWEIIARGDLDRALSKLTRIPRAVRLGWRGIGGAVRGSRSGVSKLARAGRTTSISRIARFLGVRA